MRSIDLIRQKRRFEMFNEKSKEKVLELNSFFGKYIMRFEERIFKTFTYYDTPNRDLEKSNIVLYKTQIGSFTELNMMTEKVTSTRRYNVITNFKRFAKLIKPHDSLMKHKDFLIESFANMFMSSLNFDTEFLFKKLQVAYVIKTVSTEYKSMNVSGLKITYSFDNDVYYNNFDNVSYADNILTIYQHSNEKTDADFEDLIGKLTRYCKELAPTTESKIMLARRLAVKKEEPKKDLYEEKPKKKPAKKK